MFRDAIAQRTGDPDMVQPSSAVRSLPISRAIAPPGIDFLVMRHEAPRHVVPFERLFRSPKKFVLDRSMPDHVQKVLVAPDLLLQRGYVPIAYQRNGIASLAALSVTTCFHVAHK